MRAIVWTKYGPPDVLQFQLKSGLSPVLIRSGTLKTVLKATHVYRNGRAEVEFRETINDSSTG